MAEGRIVPLRSGHPFGGEPSPLVAPSGDFAIEEHYTPQEVSVLLKLSADTIRRIFQDEPGVFRIGESFRRGKRGYVTLRIPRSVLMRVHERMSR
jgi:hypothetical protein